MSTSTASSGAPRWEEAALLIADHFAAIGERGLPRYLQLHASIEELIRSGDLASGMQMPPEQPLAAALGVSLGTVQKGLQSLTIKGLIVREHGKGTFVAPPRRSMTELWHFRFVNPETGTLLPVYSKLLKRQLVRSDEEVLQKLGADAEGYVCLTRLIDIDGRFCCHSEIFLPASRFGDLMSVSRSDLESSNLKQIFTNRFGIPTQKIDQTVRLCVLPAAVAKLLRVEPGWTGLLMEATGQSDKGAAISYQRIFIPPTDYALDVSSDHDLHELR